MARPKSASNPRFEAIDLELIDEPRRAARDTMDEVKLAELAESLREVGLIEPIVVEQLGDRYRIEAGHRRFIAAGILGWKTIPTLVFAEGTMKREAVKVHENLHREDLNAAEEAMFYSTLFEEQCEHDVDKLCALVKQGRPYVESRLLLLRGDPQIFDALKRGVINVSVARILNEVKDASYRLMYLDAAIKGGATAATVREWKNAANGIVPIEPPELGPLSGAAVQLPDLSHRFVCVCCDSEEDHHEMELVYVHRTCKRRYLDRILGAWKGEQISEQPAGSERQ